MPYGALSPSAFAPGWVLWVHPGYGSFLASCGAVGGPCYQHLVLPTVVRLHGPVPRRGRREGTACAGVVFSFCLCRTEDEMIDYSAHLTHIYASFLTSLVLALCAGSVTPQSRYGQYSTISAQHVAAEAMKPEKLFSCSCSRKSYSLKLCAFKQCSGFSLPWTLLLLLKPVNQPLACALWRSCHNRWAKSPALPSLRALS